MTLVPGLGGPGGRAWVHRASSISILGRIGIGVLFALAAACSPVTDGAKSAGQAANPDGTISTPTGIPAPTETAGPTGTLIDWSQVESVATGFMIERQDRDVAGAQAYLSEDVQFDWGPNDGRDGLTAAWAWEDAFRLVHTLDACKGLTGGTRPVARCRLRVDSEVAATSGFEPGFVCIDVTVDHDLITRVIGQDRAPGCTYDYWSRTFQPFAAWLTAAHPDTSITEMYRDRISPEGLDRWSRYTTEFIGDHSD